MTLIYHKIVDVLRGASMEIPLTITKGVTFEQVIETCNLIHAAEKFDFGELHLEANSETPWKFSLPEVTEAEREAWYAGLIPLPAPLCWYEFTLNHFRSGVLVQQGDKRWITSRFDWTSDGMMFDGHLVSLSQLRQPIKKSDHWGITIEGPESIQHAVREDRHFAANVYGSVPMIALYLSLMLNSKSTEKSIEYAPLKLNTRRVKRGLTPLADHRVVRIVPERYLRERRVEAGLTRLPPRLHWRRSHIRTLSEGRKVLVTRCLVGRASDAEVSHEYRIVT